MENKMTIREGDNFVLRDDNGKIIESITVIMTNKDKKSAQCLYSEYNSTTDNGYAEIVDYPFGRLDGYEYEGNLQDNVEKFNDEKPKLLKKLKKYKYFKRWDEIKKIYDINVDLDEHNNENIEVKYKGKQAGLILSAYLNDTRDLYRFYPIIFWLKEKLIDLWKKIVSFLPFKYLQALTVNEDINEIISIATDNYNRFMDTSKNKENVVEPTLTEKVIYNVKNALNCDCSDVEKQSCDLEIKDIIKNCSDEGIDKNSDSYKKVGQMIKEPNSGTKVYLVKEPEVEEIKPKKSSNKKQADKPKKSTKAKKKK